MSDIDLDAIEARANAATPGPWLVLRGMDCTHVRAQDGHFETGCINWDGRDASDADFIAAARTDIPALIARVREQEQEIARLRKGPTRDELEQVLMPFAESNPFTVREIMRRIGELRSSTVQP